jgi:hypothetical protein
MKADSDLSEVGGVPPLPVDFADRVLSEVARVRRRRGILGALAVCALLAIAISVTRPRLAPKSPVAPVLVAEDFEWLEEVGTSTSTPTAVVFPDESPIEENLLVSVAQNR